MSFEAVFSQLPIRLFLILVGLFFASTAILWILHEANVYINLNPFNFRLQKRYNEIMALDCDKYEKAKRLFDLYTYGANSIRFKNWTYNVLHKCVKDYLEDAGVTISDMLGQTMQ